MLKNQTEGWNWRALLKTLEAFEKCYCMFNWSWHESIKTIDERKESGNLEFFQRTSATCKKNAAGSK